MHLCTSCFLFYGKLRFLIKPKNRKAFAVFLFYLYKGRRVQKTHPIHPHCDAKFSVINQYQGSLAFLFFHNQLLRFPAHQAIPVLNPDLSQMQTVYM